MKARIWGAALLLAALCAGDARCASLGASCSAPVWDNAGTCAGPVLTAASDSVWLFLEVQSLGIRDSSRVARWNGRITRLWQVPPGAYAVRAYAAKHFYTPRDTIVVGCDTTATMRANDITPPGKPRFTPSQ